MHKTFPYSESEVAKGLRDGWLDANKPAYGLDIMPQWPEEERTHWQMYETVTEGTPISPVCDSPESLARWLADNKAPLAFQTTTYENWLKMILKGAAVSFIIAKRVPRVRLP